MEKSGAMYSWEAFWERGFITVSQSVCYAVSDGKDSLSEKEVEKVPGNDYNKVK